MSWFVLQMIEIPTIKISWNKLYFIIEFILIFLNLVFMKSWTKKNNYILYQSSIKKYFSRFLKYDLFYCFTCNPPGRAGGRGKWVLVRWSSWSPWSPENIQSMIMQVLCHQQHNQSINQSINMYMQVTCNTIKKVIK